MKKIHLVFLLWLIAFSMDAFATYTTWLAPIMLGFMFTMGAFIITAFYIGENWENWK